MSDEADALVAGDDLLRMLAALANPHRLQVLAALVGGRNYVSQLARELGMGRTLLHLHLRRLEEAGLVRGTLELSPEGKAMKFYEVTPFRLEITPASIAAAASTLTAAASDTRVQTDRTQDEESERTA